MTAKVSLPQGWSTHAIPGVGIIVQAAAGEATHILEIRDQSGVVKGYIDESGILTVPQEAIAGDENVTGVYKVSGTQVLGARNTGWTPTTGVASKAGLVADTTYTVSATPLQAEVQAIAAALTEARKVIAALQTALTTHGQIGA